jgi:hypothetical protein
MTVNPQNVTIGGGVQVGVLALFGGHHAVWASGTTQADICNNADDLVVLDCATGRKHRFPITAAFLPWLRRLIEKMNICDQDTASPWSEHNATVRQVLFSAAEGVVKQDAPQLNVLNPPLVAPAVAAGPVAVDVAILQIIEAQPESLIA